MTTCLGRVRGSISQTRAVGSFTQLIVLGILCQSGYAVPQYVYYDDGTAWYRKGVRGGYYVIDIRLTASPGWSGTIDTDWENVFSLKAD